jgi:putative membrane protein
VDPYRLTLDVDSLVVVPALAVAYALSTRLVRPSRARVVSFAAGMVLLLAVFLSPVETLALHYLLSFHLLQNVVVAEWAPALAVLGIAPALAAAIVRMPGGRAFTYPLVALPIWVATYAFWHVPWAYDFALRHHLVLHLEHATYFAAGCLVWWPVVHGGLGHARRAMYLFAAFVLASPLGLLLALLPRAIYDFYVEAPRVWDISPLTDQRIGGVAMSFEQAVIFFVLAAYAFLQFLREEDARDTYRRPTVARSR